MPTTEYTLHQDPQLPDNVAIVSMPDDPEKWLAEWGVRASDGEPRHGISIVDMKPDPALFESVDGEPVTQVEYVFLSASGLYVHEQTGIHRHGEDRQPNTGHGVCEQVPAKDEPAPDVVQYLVADLMDAPVMSKPGRPSSAEEFRDAADSEDADE